MGAEAELTVAIWGLAGFLAAASLAMVARQWLRNRTERRRLHQARAAGLHLPASLHPNGVQESVWVSAHDLL